MQPPPAGGPPAGVEPVPVGSPPNSPVVPVVDPGTGSGGGDPGNGGGIGGPQPVELLPEPV